jgi:transcriptional regulator with XRE-family HTH domain
MPKNHIELYILRAGYILYYMSYLSSVLFEARQTLGLSQTEVGRRLGWPQSQLSRIESGQVDPQLSTVTELARALDLEVMLIPRSIIPVIESLQRTARHSAERTKQVHLTERLHQAALGFAAASAVLPSIRGDTTFIAFAEYFRQALLPTSLLGAARQTADRAEHLLLDVQHGGADDRTGDFRKAQRLLRDLRRRIDTSPAVRFDAASARSAYGHDEDDHD